MKISIDTKEDSHQDIKNVIRMLSHLVGEDARTNAPSNIFADSSSSDTPTEQAGSAFVGLFGNDNSSDDPKPEEPNDTDEQPATIIEY